jgi:hypothetical protein
LLGFGENTRLILSHSVLESLIVRMSGQIILKLRKLVDQCRQWRSRGFRDLIFHMKNGIAQI